ncbi:hypothetical protein RSAG8_12188, partial [Rhizoctonia solani AG-8 WAC10335]
MLTILNLGDASCILAPKEHNNSSP